MVAALTVSRRSSYPSMPMNPQTPGQVVIVRLVVAVGDPLFQTDEVVEDHDWMDGMRGVAPSRTQNLLGGEELDLHHP